MNSIAFGVYIHIPYCKQICPYCDFTKYEMGKILPPEDYVEFLIKEIRTKAPEVLAGHAQRELNTIYFGGGTPSLLEPRLILRLIEELANAGFTKGPNCELTIEIDPATCDRAQLDSYLAMGFNRFSVGAQTFNERLLKVAGRKHSAQDTVNLLSLLKSSRVNYSFDLLFALPSQTLEELRADVATALNFDPSHLSAYCLTVPENHPMALGRAPEDEQTEMFDLVETALAAKGIMRYEISNFAKPGFESRHNLLYWTDQAYWGLGTSAHSYFPRGFSEKLDEKAPWGTRFWNAPSIKGYENEIAAITPDWNLHKDIPEERLEILEKHQSLTDFCHTSLRLVRGLDENALRLKFGEGVAKQTTKIFVELESTGLAAKTTDGWALTTRGQLLANTVFGKLTFLKDELVN